VVRTNLACVGVQQSRLIATPSSHWQFPEAVIRSATHDHLLIRWTSSRGSVRVKLPVALFMLLSGFSPQVRCASTFGATPCRASAHSTCSLTNAEGSPRRMCNAASTSGDAGALPSATAILRDHRSYPIR
jgi:hypothetical protein